MLFSKKKGVLISDFPYFFQNHVDLQKRKKVFTSIRSLILLFFSQNHSALFTSICSDISLFLKKRSLLQFDLIFRYFSPKIMVISKRNIYSKINLYAVFLRGSLKKEGGARANYLICLTQYPPLVLIINKQTILLYFNANLTDLN